MSDRTRTRTASQNRDREKEKSKERAKSKARAQSKECMRMLSRERLRFLEMAREDECFDDDINAVDDSLEEKDVDGDVDLHDEDSYVPEGDAADVMDADGILNCEERKIEFVAENRDEIVVVQRDDGMHCIIPDNQFMGCRPKDAYGEEAVSLFSLQKCRSCYRKIALWLEQYHQEWLSDPSKIFPLQLKDGEELNSRTGGVEQKWFCLEADGEKLDDKAFPYFIRSCRLVWQSKKCALPLERLFGL